MNQALDFYMIFFSFLKKLLEFLLYIMKFHYKKSITFQLPENITLEFENLNYF